MKTLIPITSLSNNHGSIVTLLNPKQLFFDYDFTCPVRLEKTVINIDAKKWSIGLLENYQFHTLLDSDVCDKLNITTPIDLIQQLGHGLTIMPWQRLQVQITEGHCDAVSYIEDSLQE
jgi:hypothetical protein